MTKRIAILDDESDIVDLISINLKKANYEPDGYTDVNVFYKGIESSKPDLIILDLMLPGFDGFDICKDIRSNPNLKAVPIIMLTARDEEVDKILGLELGADDYMTKPFSPKELTARIKAIFRRTNTQGGSGKVRVLDDMMVIDPQKYEVTVNGDRITLTPTEFKILDLLTQKRGWVYTRQQLLTYLWGNEKMVIDRTIDVHIRHLREKLGSAGDMIKNVRGVGYKIE